MAATTSGQVLAPHDHVVNLYDADEHLVTDVSRFVAEGLIEGEGVAVIATRARWTPIEAELRARDIDLQAACDSGQCCWLDAEGTLSRFMVGGTPDPDRFRTVVGGLITRVGAGGRPVRAFGEMVAVLWEDGDVAGALELESLWNKLAQDHRFSLCCAYPMSAVVGGGDLDALQQVCAQHSELVAPRSYPARSMALECDPTEECSQLFLPVPSAIGAARRFVANALTRGGHDAVVGDATLVVSELATNAVLHARSPFRLSVNQSGLTVRLAVEDTSTEPVQRREASVHTVGGRGIPLVDSLSARWNVELESGGKTVWAELRGSRP